MLRAKANKDRITSRKALYETRKIYFYTPVEFLVRETLMLGFECRDIPKQDYIQINYTYRIRLIMWTYMRRLHSKFVIVLLIALRSTIISCAWTRTPVVPLRHLLLCTDLTRVVWPNEARGMNLFVTIWTDVTRLGEKRAMLNCKSI